MRRGQIVSLALLALCAILAFNPSMTGPVAHEWASLAFAVLALGHCAIRTDWFKSATHSVLHSRASGARVARLALNGLTFVAFVVCAVSGIMVSGEALRLLGFYAPGYYFWSPLHAASAKVLMALLIIHVGLHARAIAALVRAKGRGRLRRENRDQNDGVLEPTEDFR